MATRDVQRADRDVLRSFDVELSVEFKYNRGDKNLMLAIFYTAIFVCGSSLPLIYFHTQIHGFNLLQSVLSLFCSINLLICWWEIGLFFNRALIKAQYTAFKKRLKRNEMPSPMFLLDHATLGQVRALGLVSWCRGLHACTQALSLEYWALVWSTYSLIDPR